MARQQAFEEFLETHQDRNPTRQNVATVLIALAHAFAKINTIVARGPLGGDLARGRGSNTDGDTQKELDIVANDIVIEALRDAPVAYLLSEELDEPVILQAGADLLVAVDPLDGSSNIETNAPIGTIVSVMRNIEADTIEQRFLQRGREQVAAVYCIYGPQTMLLVTQGDGTTAFTLDPADDRVLPDERTGRRSPDDHRDRH